MQLFKRLPYYFYYAIIICTCTVNNIYAQKIVKDYIVNTQLLSIENGLAARDAYCGIQDENGFIWFGTRNGLNRYDGKKFLLFNKRNSKIQENDVIKIATDMNKHLFILYGYSGYSRWASGKVDVLNQETFTVQSLTQTFKNLPFKEENVYWIANDDTDTIHILTHKPYQLWQYTAKKGFTLRFEMKDWNTKTFIYSVPTGPYNYFNKNMAFVGFGGHEKLYIINQHSFTKLVNEPPGSYSIVSFNNNQLIVKRLFNNETAVKYYGINTNNTPTTIANPITEKNLQQVLNKNAIAHPVINDTGCIFNSKGKAILYYNNQSLIPIIDSSTTKKLSTLSVYEAFVDKLGNTWICTSIGIFKCKIARNNFTHFFTREQQKKVINNQVRNIAVDNDNTVFANVADYCMAQPNNKTAPKYVFGNTLLYALFSHNNTIFTANENVFAYNKNSNRLLAQENTNNGRTTLSALPINDSVWLLGKMERIYTYHIKSKQLKLAVNGAELPLKFFKRKDGTIWAACDNGLYLLTNNGDSIACFNNTPKATQPLLVENITDVFEDDKNNVWLTTNGNGLYKWNKQQNIVKNYGLENGLPSNILYRIEEDDQQNLWISTENGLAFFNPITEFVNNFFEKDGLSENEFNRMSSYKASDGRLFFGGLNGVNAFYPSQIIKQITTLNIPLRLIAYQKFSGKTETLIDETNKLQSNATIVLNPGDKFFTIEYKLLDFEDKVHTYAYKIEGQDKDWNYTTENSIRISGMTYGKYTLVIKAQQANGQWSNSMLVYTVEVNAPFYRKARFVVTGILLFVAVVFGFINYRTAKLKKDKEQLEQTVKNRTAQLQTTVNEREILLKEIHHRVKNNLQIISGLLDLQKEEIEAEESKAVFNEGQSRVKSIALIHQNLYQNDNLANIRFNTFVKELTTQVSEVFEQLNTKLEVTIHMDEVYLDIDTAIPLGLIVNELLTNAYKYAALPNTVGQVHITLQNYNAGAYLLIFTDNGPGLQNNVHFETADTLGLRLIKGLAAQLNGEATYRYNNGSVFEISFKNSEARRLEE